MDLEPPGSKCGSTKANCAGAMRAHRTMTAEGLETVFAVQYLARFLLEGGLARRDVTITCRTRFAVQVIGDYIRFTTPAGDDLARIYLPWLSREDREELVGRIGSMVEHSLRPTAADRAPTGP